MDLAVGYCHDCGDPVCIVCGVSAFGTVYCPDHDPSRTRPSSGSSSSTSALPPVEPFEPPPTAPLPRIRAKKPIDWIPVTLLTMIASLLLFAIAIGTGMIFPKFGEWLNFYLVTILKIGVGYFALLIAWTSAPSIRRWLKTRRSSTPGSASQLPTLFGTPPPTQPPPISVTNHPAGGLWNYLRGEWKLIAGALVILVVVIIGVWSFMRLMGPSSPQKTAANSGNSRTAPPAIPRAAQPAPAQEESASPGHILTTDEIIARDATKSGTETGNPQETAEQSPEDSPETTEYSSGLARVFNQYGIKFTPWTEALGATDSGIHARDGGTFSEFVSFAHSHVVAIGLLMSDLYKNLTLNDALFTWSGKGYDGRILPGTGLGPQMRVKDLGQDQLEILLTAIQKREGVVTPAGNRSSRRTSTRGSGGYSGAVTSIVPTSFSGGADDSSSIPVCANAIDLRFDTEEYDQIEITIRHDCLSGEIQFPRTWRLWGFRPKTDADKNGWISIWKTGLYPSERFRLTETNRADPYNHSRGTEVRERFRGEGTVVFYPIDFK